MNLAGCWAKMQRSVEHLETLRQEISRRHYMVELVQGWDPLGNAEFVVKSVPDPPMRWATIVGDVVHNLRSALDHAVCAVTLA
jgi:hypothetical protein